MSPSFSSRARPALAAVLAAAALSGCELLGDSTGPKRTAEGAQC